MNLLFALWPLFLTAQFSRAHAPKPDCAAVADRAVFVPLHENNQSLTQDQAIRKCAEMALQLMASQEFAKINFGEPVTVFMDTLSLTRLSPQRTDPSTLLKNTWVPRAWIAEHEVQSRGASTYRLLLEWEIRLHQSAQFDPSGSGAIFERNLELSCQLKRGYVLSLEKRTSTEIAGVVGKKIACR